MVEVVSIREREFDEAIFTNVTRLELIVDGKRIVHWNSFRMTEEGNFAHYISKSRNQWIGSIIYKYTDKKFSWYK